jgi:hypothetical protein
MINIIETGIVGAGSKPMHLSAKDHIGIQALEDQEPLAMIFVQARSPSPAP